MNLSTNLCIGAGSCLIYPDKNRSIHWPKTLCYLEGDTARYFDVPGVTLILIPEISHDGLKRYVDELDGLVLQGGSDIAPQFYGESPIEDGRWPGDPARDAHEKAILDLAVARRLPILGICRGAQLLNAYFKGTLYQDLETQAGKVVEHRNRERYDHVSHGVRIEAGGVLSEIYPGVEEARINSVHHQGIKDVAPGFRVEARSSDDGVVEAISHQVMNQHWILGVQWHPEFSPTLAGQLLDEVPLRESFLEACRKAKLCQQN
jgi:putative glutamine amidotransferase